MKNYLAIALMLFGLSSNAQSKKEIIDILNVKLDSLQRTIDFERLSSGESLRKLEIQIASITESNKMERVMLSEKIDSLNQCIEDENTKFNTQLKRVNEAQIELQKLLDYTKNVAEKSIKEVSIRDGEIEKLQYNRQRVIDSLSNYVSSEANEKTIEPKSIAYFKSITKKNIIGTNYLELAANVKLISQVKYYVQKNNGEAAYFEKMLDNKVVLRGFALSACGDCAQIVLSYYTIDGYMYLQEFYKGCSMEFPDYVSVKVEYYLDEFPDKSVSVELNRAFIDLPECLNPNDPQFYIKSLREATYIPSNFSITNLKPEVLDCVLISSLN